MPSIELKKIAWFLLEVFSFAVTEAKFTLLSNVLSIIMRCDMCSMCFISVVCCDIGNGRGRGGGNYGRSCGRMTGASMNQ